MNPHEGEPYTHHIPSVQAVVLVLSGLVLFALRHYGLHVGAATLKELAARSHRK